MEQGWGTDRFGQTSGVGISDRRTQYENPPLDVDDLLADPVAQWRQWYDEAVAAGVDEPNAMALATVDGDGHPDCRFVLVRGADAHGFTFFTNLESAKARQLRSVPWAALTFAWMRMHRQVRLRGAVEQVDRAEADAYFANRPRGSQLAAWASPQSSVLANRADLDARYAAASSRFSGDVPRPPHWGGFRVRPGEFEFWQGRANRLHDRFRYRRANGGSWTIERLAP